MGDGRPSHPPTTEDDSHGPRPPPPAPFPARDHGSGDTAVHALDGITVGWEGVHGDGRPGREVDAMHCMAGLDAPTSAPPSSATRPRTSGTGVTALRRTAWAVFQSFNLVPTLTAEENITLPAKTAGGGVDKQWFEEVTGRFGIADRLDHRPAELSGGQQQRVACARAIVSRPEIIFGDEPTGNLDSNASHEVLAILRSAVDEMGQTVVIVTHDPTAAAWADRVLFLADGKLVHELRDPDAEAILTVMTGFER